VVSRHRHHQGELALFLLKLRIIIEF
jgi:hypothetical protein